MRLDEELQTSGYFWLPSNSEQKIPGNLVIKDGGEIELEVVGLFDNSIDGIRVAMNGSVTIDRIIGHVERYGLITLDESFYKNRNISFGGISKSKIHVNKAFLGVAYKENEEIFFNSFQFSVEGIDEWVGSSGIRVEHFLEKSLRLLLTLPPRRSH